MDKELIRTHLLSAVEEYLSTPEAWGEPLLSINRKTGEVDIVDDDEGDDTTAEVDARIPVEGGSDVALPESAGDHEDDRNDIDYYNIMDFIKMTPDGEWIPDSDAISSLDV